MSTRRIPVLPIAIATCLGLGATSWFAHDPRSTTLVAPAAYDVQVERLERASEPARPELSGFESRSIAHVDSVDSDVEQEVAGGPATPVAPEWGEVRRDFVGRMYLDQERLRTVLEQTIQSPLAPDAAWLEERYGPAASPAALAATESAMIEHNLRIEFESRGYLADLARAVAETIDGDRFDRNAGPVQTSSSNEPALLIQSQSYQGWNSVLAIRRREYPELSNRQGEIVRMADARDEACLKLMRGG